VIPKLLVKEIGVEYHSFREFCQREFKPRKRKSL